MSRTPLFLEVEAGEKFCSGCACTMSCPFDEDEPVEAEAGEWLRMHVCLKAERLARAYFALEEAVDADLNEYTGKATVSALAKLREAKETP
jgi:hypothetical protein